MARMFKAIGDFFSGLWRFANFWRVSPIGEARVGSPLAGGLLFLFLVFCVIGLVLVVLGSTFGFTLEETFGGVDAWLANMGPTLDLVGKVLIQKVLMGIILLVSVVGAWSLLRDRFGRSRGARPGWGKTILLLLVCLLFGYCSTVNMIAPLEPYDPSLTDVHYN
jgi:hypothetical protein